MYLFQLFWFGAAFQERKKHLGRAIEEETWVIYAEKSYVPVFMQTSS